MDKSQINIEGAATGRISSKFENKSNTPRYKRPQSALDIVEQRFKLWGASIKNHRIKQNIARDLLCHWLKISDIQLDVLEKGSPSMDAGTYLHAFEVLGILDILAPTPKTAFWQSEVPFLELCIAGAVSAEVIDDFVENWHTDSEIHAVKTLQEYLGFTKQEYASWMKEASCLPQIIHNRQLATYRF